MVMVCATETVSFWPVILLAQPAKIKTVLVAVEVVVVVAVWASVAVFSNPDSTKQQLGRVAPTTVEFAS